MGDWTHVNATFRLDSFGKILDKNIIEKFGKEVGYYDMNNEFEYNDDFEVKNKEKYLPFGSGGTLHMSIWHNPSKIYLPSTTVNVFGDLSNFNSFDDIMEWFDRVCKNFCIRQAVCQVEVEYVGEKVFIYDNENQRTNVIEVKMTRQEAIENHRKMWNWISEKSLENKRKVNKAEFFISNKFKKIPLSYCFCCEYDNQEGDFITYTYCSYCPIDWGSKEKKFSCEHDEYRDSNGLFSRWNNEEDYIKAAELAKQIAELPERIY